MPELLSNVRCSRQRPAAVLRRAACRSTRHGASSTPGTPGERRAHRSPSRVSVLLPTHADAAGVSESGTPNDPSLCSSGGSLIRYNSVSRTPSHTETSQGVLQVGDHVKSNQMPIKTSSGVGRRLLPRSTPVPGSSTAHLPSLPCTRASPPLPHQDGPSFSNTPDTRGGMGRDILLPARPSSPAPRSPPSLDGPLCPRATSLRKGGY